MTNRGFLLVGLVTTGCSVDHDADGLSAAAERRYQTDPGNPDTDGDGLLDGVEIDRGSNPLSADTDGDGYTDGDEVFEGSDPSDAASRIYVGGWPYVRDKSGFDDPDYTGTARPGDPTPRLRLVDQFGDTVDLADFAQPGEETLLQVCGASWGICPEFAKWLHDDPSATVGWNTDDEVLARLATGESAWIAVISEGPERGTPPVYQDVLDWSARYGDRVPILFDEHQQVRDWAWQHREVPGMPQFVLVSDDLSIRQNDSDGDARLFQSFYTFIDVL